MHGPINVKSLNNTSKWQMGFDSAFKGLITNTNFMEISGEEGWWIEQAQDRVK
jgi:hypothetical protein